MPEDEGETNLVQALSLLDPAISDHEPSGEMIDGDLPSKEKEPYKVANVESQLPRRAPVDEEIERTVKRNLRRVSEKDLGGTVLRKVGDETRRNLGFPEEYGALEEGRR